VTWKKRLGYKRTTYAKEPLRIGTCRTSPVPPGLRRGGLTLAWAMALSYTEVVASDIAQRITRIWRGSSEWAKQRW
jgi:hypothetical protein